MNQKTCLGSMSNRHVEMRDARLTDQVNQGAILRA